VFAKQVLALGRPGDLLVAISTSGNAKSVLRAVDAARAAGVATLAMTGGDGGRLAARADRVLLVSSTRQTPRIQEGHCLMMHMICEQVEERLVAIGGADAATTATE
jgi:phosphoheptose isomerase